MRWIEDDGHVSVFRTPSNNSNGNSFDFQGRQLSCEHLTRRVVRYELDGSTTVLADTFWRQELNSPNDVVAHPDGSYWFTDPPYGGQLYEGEPDVAGGPSNAAGKLNPRIGQPAGFVPGKRELPTNCYRIDPCGRVDLVVTEDQVPDPERPLLLAGLQEALRRQHRQGAGRYRPRRQGRHSRVRCRHRQQALQPEAVHRLHDRRHEVRTGRPALRRRRQPLVPPAMPAAHVGYSGVTVWNPDGKLIGRIRLPEVCGNVCFGGPKRNRLFMAASQSLYAVYHCNARRRTGLSGAIKGRHGRE